MGPPLPPKVFLTGLPGSGKTTLIRGFVDRFPKIVRGFYTEEVRDETGQRIGFDLVSHAGERAVFARKGGGSRKRVGRYSVFLEPLETWGLELLQPSSDRPLVILDEVGKMECLSRVFQERVLELIDTPDPILGSVALRGGGLIRRIHEHQKVECREVSQGSRDRFARQLEMEYRDYLEAEEFPFSRE
jgi:nucleoside-triphosphatase